MSGIADILDAAADKIMIDGHWQNNGQNFLGTCALLAINPKPEDADAGEAAEALCHYIGAINVVSPSLTRTSWIGITKWNDATPTDEVIDTMRRCAKALREVMP